MAPFDTLHISKGRMPTGHTPVFRLLLGSILRFFALQGQRVKYGMKEGVHRDQLKLNLFTEFEDSSFTRYKVRKDDQNFKNKVVRDG